jgi:putative nucleotidyltransferase with HDIG domain
MQHAPTLHHKIFTNLILIVVIMVVLISGLSSVFLYNYLRQTTTEKISLVADNVLKALEIQDRVNLTQELWLYRLMEKPMLKFQALYEQNGGNPGQIQFSQLNELNGKYLSFAIVDSNQEICHSSYYPDIGTDLAYLGEFLDYVKSYPGIIHSPRAYYSDNSMQKVIYQATPDKKYVLSIRAALDKNQYMFETAEDYYFDFAMYIKEIMNRSEMIKNIRIFDETGAALFVSNSQPNPPLQGERLQLFEKVLRSGSSATLDTGNTVYHYAFFQPHDLGYQSLAGKVIEISIDTRSFYDILLKAVLVTILIAVVSLLIALFLGYVFGKKIVAPLSAVTCSVHQIAAGDLSVPLSSTGNVIEINSLAASVENMRVKLLKQISELEKRNAEIAQSYQLTIQAFFRTLQHREQYTAEHSIGVNKLSIALGQELKLSKAELQDLEWGSLLHDVGKLVIGNEILQKPSRLTEDEFAIIRNHPVVGYDLLPKMPFFKNAADIVHYHHERYDGLGYPEGLAGQRIPLLARICAVADSLHAMISHRPYRQACRLEEAIKEVKRCAGSQFDPIVVEALLRVYNNNSQFLAENSSGGV